MTALADYLREAARVPWRWGENDCCTFTAQWVMLRGNSDPMAFIRGQYDSARTALRRISEGGGLTPLWTRGMIEAGVPEADFATVGDVGIIPALTADDGPDQACAIFSGTRWITRAVRGLESAPAEALIIWRP